jgi:hypothetical protein
VAIRKAILVVKMVYDYPMRKFASCIEYPEEGFDVLLRVEGNDINLKDFFTSVLSMCRAVKENKGDMISFGLRLIFDSPELRDDFVRWRSSDGVVLKTADIDTVIQEDLNTDIPSLFASVGPLEQRDGQSLPYHKFKKKKTT